ncbi:hypothetical protein [Nocardia thailandica]
MDMLVVFLPPVAATGVTVVRVTSGHSTSSPGGAGRRGTNTPVGDTQSEIAVGTAGAGRVARTDGKPPGFGG